MSKPEYFVIKRETCPECKGGWEYHEFIESLGRGVPCKICTQGVIERYVPLKEALNHFLNIPANATIDSLTIEPQYPIGQRHPD